jgi:hypothetical protein
MEVEDSVVDDDDVDEFHYEMDVDEQRYSISVLGGHVCSNFESQVQFAFEFLLHSRPEVHPLNVFFAGVM